MICECCHKDKPDVRERVCGFMKAVYGIEYLEDVCDDCEDNHEWEI